MIRQYDECVDFKAVISLRRGDCLSQAVDMIDQQGRIAYVNFGEGNYSATDDAVRTLLNATAMPTPSTISPPSRTASSAISTAAR